MSWDLQERVGVTHGGGKGEAVREEARRKCSLTSETKEQMQMRREEGWTCEGKEQTLRKSKA